MAWNEAWDASTIYIGAHDFVSSEDLPSVKHLLEDLCLAIQERHRLLKQDSCEFITATDLNIEEPTAADFVGASIQYVKTMLQAMIDNLEGMVSGSGPRFFKDDSFVDLYTGLEDLIDDVAMMDYAEWIELPWRQFYFWETFQAAVKKLRYMTRDITVTGGSGSREEGTLDEANGVDGLSPQDSWDSLTTVATGNGTLIMYAMEGVPGSGQPAYYLGNCLSTYFYGWQNMMPRRIQSSEFSWAPTVTITHEYSQVSVISVELTVIASNSASVTSDSNGQPQAEGNWGGMAEVMFTVAGNELVIPACDDNDYAEETYTINVGTLEGESVIEMDELTTIPGYPHPCDSWELRWGFSGGAGISTIGNAYLDLNAQFTYPA